MSYTYIDTHTHTSNHHPNDNLGSQEWKAETHNILHSLCCGAGFLWTPNKHESVNSRNRKSKCGVKGVLFQSLPPGRRTPGRERVMTLWCF